MSKNNINETKSQITSEGGMPEVKQRVTMSVVDMELFQINKKNAKTLGEGWLKTLTIPSPHRPPLPQACQSFYTF